MCLDSRKISIIGCCRLCLLLSVAVVVVFNNLSRFELRRNSATLNYLYFVVVVVQSFVRI